MTGADSFDSFQVIVVQANYATLVNTCWELDGQPFVLDLCFVMSDFFTPCLERAVRAGREYRATTKLN